MAKEYGKRIRLSEEEVEMILKKQIGVKPNIHIDPVFPDNPMVKEVRNKLESISKIDKRIKSIYDIRIVNTNNHNLILFANY